MLEPGTARALDALNRRFYRLSAVEFDASRQRPWRGWDHLVPEITRRATERHPKILDLGCGNARFGRFLHSRGVGIESYVGLDRSRPLLEAARASPLPRALWVESDLVAHGTAAIASREPFDLIALFGVLHHIPGFSARRALLRSCRARLSPDGILIVTLWRFLDNAEGWYRPIAWSECERRTGIAIDAGRLEPGDSLLPFGKDETMCRYAHHFDAAEPALLLAGLPYETVATFEADGDGRSNLYLVLRPSDS